MYALKCVLLYLCGGLGVDLHVPCCVVLLCACRFEVKMVELGKVANFVGQVAELAALAELVCTGIFCTHPPSVFAICMHPSTHV
jgi:hypothetical protein